MEDSNLHLLVEKLQADNESHRHMLEYSKEVNSGLTYDIKTALKTTEDLTELLSEFEDNFEDLKKKHENLTGELENLKRENETQKNLIDQSKTYALLLERMIDDANADNLAQEKSRKLKEQQDMELAKEATTLLQKENEELHAMMEEFGRMWSTDSKQFHETMKVIKNEKETLKKEATDLRQAFEDKIREVEASQELIDETREVLEKATDTNFKLHQEIDKFKSEMSIKNDEITLLLEERELVNVETQQDRCRARKEIEGLMESLDEMRKLRDEEQIRAENSHMELNELRRSHKELKERLDVELHVSQDSREKYTKQEKENAELRHVLEKITLSNEKDAATFMKALHQMRDELNDSKDKLEESERIHRECNFLLGESNEKSWNLESQISSLLSEKSTIIRKKEEIEQENEKLREQLRLRILEKEKMEGQHDNVVMAMKESYARQIETIKHNNMMSINQEIIKAQMALESEKKNYTMEIARYRNDLKLTSGCFDAHKKDACQKIADLNEEISKLRECNKALVEERSVLKTHKTAEREESLRQIDSLREQLVKCREAHEKEVKRLIETHKELMDNMGVEELNEEIGAKFETDSTESIEWEVIDEN